jgi:hypothetical protein
LRHLKKSLVQAKKTICDYEISSSAMEIIDGVEIFFLSTAKSIALNADTLGNIKT